MAFTAEELMIMQEEVEREHNASLEGDSKIDDSAKDGESTEEVIDETGKKEGEVGGEAKAKEDEKRVAGDKAAGEAEKGKEKEVIADDEEVRELREVTRAQKAELEKVTAEYERLTKILKDKGLIDEEDEKTRHDQEALARDAYEKRIEALNNVLEVMKVNPRYEDVEEVVSQRNFDDMIAALAKYHVSQHGGDVTRTLTEVEREVWALPNPYKYMYDMIRRYHPAYAQKEKEPVAKEKEVPASGEKPKDQAFSLQNLPGGSGKDGGGWTTAKIDALDEMELSKVPIDIYTKYMRGDLK